MVFFPFFKKKKKKKNRNIIGANFTYAHLWIMLLEHSLDDVSTCGNFLIVNYEGPLDMIT